LIGVAVWGRCDPDGGQNDFENQRKGGWSTAPARDRALPIKRRDLLGPPRNRTINAVLRKLLKKKLFLILFYSFQISATSLYFISFNHAVLAVSDLAFS